jgi:hypothetical protein
MQLNDSNSTSMQLNDSNSTSTGAQSVDVEGSNREEADFLKKAADEDAEERNYAVTKRWKLRQEIWKCWMDKHVLGDDLDLNELQLLTGDELFLTINHTSQLGKELVAFGAGIEESKAKIQECKEDIVTMKEEIKTLENDLENVLAAGFIGSMQESIRYITIIIKLH